MDSGGGLELRVHVVRVPKLLGGLLLGLFSLFDGRGKKATPAPPEE